MGTTGSCDRSPTVVPLSDFPGPQRRAHLLRQARIFQIATVVLGGVFVGGVVRWFFTRLTGDGLTTREWLLDLPGSVLCAALIGFVPYSLARSYRRGATTTMWLDGSRLVIADAYDRREVDLVERICHVKLVGGRKANYLPMLLAYRDQTDVWPTQVDLTEPATHVLRPPQDMLALAAVLQSSPREENQAAAGRLRTLATWKSLPTIFGADPDAIPITPPEGPPAGPTPVQAAKPSPEVALPVRPPIRSVRRAAADLGLVVAAVVLGLSALTVNTVTLGTQAFESEARQGVARAVECVRYGPVSGSGFGYWYECQAEVAWNDDSRQTLSTRNSVLTPDHFGRDVRVQETRDGRRGNGFYRLDDPPRAWGAVLFLPLFLAGLLCLLRPAADVFRLVRRLARGQARRRPVTG